MPKTTSTPTRSRASTSACAPVTRTGAAWCGRGAGAVCAAPPGCAPTGWTGPGCAGPPGWALPPGWAVAGRGGADLGAAVLAGMSNGEGACALEGTGLLCSVIGWFPCHDVRGCLSSGEIPRPPEGGIKKPLVPGGSRGARAGTGLVSSLRASQVRECGSASRVPPSPTRRPLVKLSRPASQYLRRSSRRRTRRVPQSGQLGRGDARLGRAVDVGGGGAARLGAGLDDAGPDERLHAGCRHRPGDEEALTVAAPHLAQFGELAR